VGPEPDPRDRLAEWAGVSRRELECFEEELVLRWTEVELSDELAWRIRRAHRLRAQLGLDYEAIEIILRLVHRIEELEAAARADAAMRILSED
jgi:hypothetical protein